jgi:hypothetical protein
MRQFLECVTSPDVRSVVEFGRPPIHLRAAFSSSATFISAMGNGTEVIAGPVEAALAPKN